VEIVALYLDDKFNDYLVYICGKNRIDSFDDYKQSLMLLLFEDGYSSVKHAKMQAKNLAQRIKRVQQKRTTFSLIENTDSFLDNERSPLWEDNHYL
jgi:hypothetical protein